MDQQQLKREHKLNILKLKVYKEIIKDVALVLDKSLSDYENSKFRLEKLKKKVDGYI